LKTRVWCYDHNYNEIPSGDDPGISYPRTILSDERAAQFVDGVAFHGYAGRPSGMSAFKREFPRVPVYFTEGSVFGVRGGLQLIERLRNQASSYNAWVTMLDDNRKPNNGPFPASRTILTLNPTTLEVNEQFDFDLYGHFMKFIARGAVRLESSEGDRQAANVAFRNPDGTVVLVVVNAGSADRCFLIRCGERQASVSLRAASAATLAWKGD
jgi:O-glycosyl hydrolase